MQVEALHMNRNIFNTSNAVKFSIRYKMSEFGTSICQNARITVLKVFKVWPESRQHLGLNPPGKTANYPFFHPHSSSFH